MITETDYICPKCREGRLKRDSGGATGHSSFYGEQDADWDIVECANCDYSAQYDEFAEKYGISDDEEENAACNLLAANN